MNTSTIRRTLWEVNAALVPGIGGMVWFFGIGVLANLITCVVVAVICEASVLALRKRSLATLLDGSAVMTGILMALCLSPLIPLTLLVPGVAIAIVFGKQLYGGLGHNPFNPAMVGYAVLILSFPTQMTLWPSLSSDPLTESLTVTETVAIKLHAEVPDAVTMATPLDQMKFRGSLTTSEVWASSPGSFGTFGGAGWEVVNLLFLAGGVHEQYCEGHTVGIGT